MKTGKFLKAFYFAILIVLFTGVNNFAQKRPGEGPPPIPDKSQIIRMVDDLSNELDLTKEQADKIEELFVEHFNEMKALHKETKHPDREEIDKLKAKFENEVKNLLDEEQFEQFTEFMNELRDNHRPRR